MTEEKINRINALARKSRTAEGLTEAEKQEQAVLRQEYIDAMRNSLISQLEHTFIVDEQGNKRPLKKKADAGE